MRLAQGLVLFGTILVFVNFSVQEPLHTVLYIATVFFVICGAVLAILHNRNKRNERDRDLD